MGETVHGKQSTASYSPSSSHRAAAEVPVPGRNTLTAALPPSTQSAPAQCKTAWLNAPAAAPAPSTDRLETLFGGAIQRKADGPAGAAAPAPSRGGSPMPAEVRARMERAFGADFSAVRVHQGDHAAAIGAQAYTRGTDIHFAPGKYDPSSTAGQELLGHELTHVVQQSQGRVNATVQKKGVAINDDAALEHEADQLGARAARGEAVHGGDHAPAAIAAMSGAAVQRNKTTEESNIPVQTTGNCGLFSILTALRAFGFSGDIQSQAMSAMDQMTKDSEDTFLGEIFTVDLMLKIINDLEVDGKQILEGKAVEFKSQKQLEKLLAKYKKRDDVALLIGYSKPDEYDNYYNDRGKFLQGELDRSELNESLNDKVNVEDFKVQDAHWGMINTISNDGFVDIADSLSEHKKGSGHGYNTLMSTRKLYNSNKSLDDGKFNWDSFLNPEAPRSMVENDQITYPSTKSKDVTKDLSNNQRYHNIKEDGMREKLDLSGKLVVVTVTKRGKAMLEGK